MRLDRHQSTQRSLASSAAVVRRGESYRMVNRRMFLGLLVDRRLRDRQSQLGQASLRGKGQENIAWDDSAVMRIAGVHKEHSAYDRSVGIAHRPAVGLHTVHGGVILNRVKLPEDFPGLRRIGV